MKRINLLPPEIIERRRRRRQALILASAALAWVLLLSAVWIVRNAELRREEERLADARAQVRTLQGQIAALEEFDRLDKEAREKEQALAGAMANDVAWARLLIELSMIIPGDSWLTTFSGGASAPAEGAPAAPTAGPAGPKFGSLSFAVVTFDFPGVARWLTRLQELESFQNIWVPSATKGQIGTRDVVNFGSTVDLSGAALSNRYKVGSPQ